VSALAAGVVLLGRALREAGVPVVPSDEVDAALALARLPHADRDEARRALRIALKVRREQWAAFDAVLDAVWREAEVPDAPLEREGRVPREGRSAGEPLHHPPPAKRGEGRGEGQDPESPTPGFSSEALLRKKPFDACTSEDLAAMVRLLERLGQRLATRKSRRLAPTHGRGVPDLRRSLRRAVATDGDPVRLARRARRVEEPKLVVLCDTSGSMDAHARFLLAFVLALRRAARSTEVFAFNTSLVRLTPALARGRIGDVLARLAAEVPDWSGGTRIGECLAAFVERHLRERVDARTVVVILSDGLDRGDVSALADAMRAIRARARRVVWLNPLLGDARYEPTARGMAAALPFVDRFLPAHDLASLEAMLPHLSA
jgi:uncharacterized protein